MQEAAVSEKGLLLEYRRAPTAVDVGIAGESHQGGGGEWRLARIASSEALLLSDEGQSLRVAASLSKFPFCAMGWGPASEKTRPAKIWGLLAAEFSRVNPWAVCIKHHGFGVFLFVFPLALVIAKDG